MRWSVSDLPAVQARVPAVTLRGQRSAAATGGRASPLRAAGAAENPPPQAARAPAAGPGRPASASAGPGWRRPAGAGRTAPARPRRHPQQEGRPPASGPGRAGAAMADQLYCHRLQHDMYFLTSNSRLNEQVVDKIILQLNRVYPQILTNAEAEKFRNPKASLHTRLSDLIKHLQKKGDRHCQEFYRALQINAEQLYNDLPSRKVLSPVFFLACFSVAAGFAIFWYCCNSDTKVIGRARRILGFSPIIIGRHVRNICMLYLEDLSRN
ncbi:caspase recruitment domain-containing protein 19 isoform 2-T2 [Alca torda]